MTYDHWKTTEPERDDIAPPHEYDRDDWLDELQQKHGRIRTHHEYPPIPRRDHDWYAILDDVYDGAPDAGPQFMGWGSTEDEAIRDLVQQVEDDTP